MFEGKYIFSQLMDFVPWRRLQSCINRYNGDYKIIAYRCAEQFRVMAFAPLTYRHSLREVAGHFATKCSPFRLYFRKSALKNSNDLPDRNTGIYEVTFTAAVGK